MATELLVLRVLHVLGAAALIGAVLFNYLIVRPSLRLIPPAHAVVIGQSVGTGFMYLGWVALLVLGLSGTLRMLIDERFWHLLDPLFYASGSGRAIGIMVLSWIVTLVSAAVMTWILRPVLMSKLSPKASPDLAAVERRRAAQMAANQQLERLQIINAVFATLAAVAGASVSYGGLF